jgi:hypothetical protein
MKCQKGSLEIELEGWKEQLGSANAQAKTSKLQFGQKNDLVSEKEQEISKLQAVVSNLEELTSRQKQEITILYSEKDSFISLFETKSSG